MYMEIPFIIDIICLIKYIDNKTGFHRQCRGKTNVSGKCKGNIQKKRNRQTSGFCHKNTKSYQKHVVKQLKQIQEKQKKIKKAKNMTRFGIVFPTNYNVKE